MLRNKTKNILPKLIIERCALVAHLLDNSHHQGFRNLHVIVDEYALHTSYALLIFEITLNFEWYTKVCRWNAQNIYTPVMFVYSGGTPTWRLHSGSVNLCKIFLQLG